VGVAESPYQAGPDTSVNGASQASSTPVGTGTSRTASMHILSVDPVCILRVVGCCQPGALTLFERCPRSPRTWRKLPTRPQNDPRHRLKAIYFLTVLNHTKAAQTTTRAASPWVIHSVLSRWQRPRKEGACGGRPRPHPGRHRHLFHDRPEGDTRHGWWQVSTVEAPRYLEFIDGFADADGNPNPKMPVTNTRVRLHEESGGTWMEITTVVPTAHALKQSSRWA